MYFKFLNVVKLFIAIILFNQYLSAQEDVNYSTGVSLYGYKNYQNFSVSPQISFWKFNLILDLELFFDLEKNSVDWKKTLDTSTGRTLANSLLRKINYFGFSNRDDVVFGKEIFHIGFGSIENISLGTGILVNRFQNKYNYPEIKHVGMSFAFNGQKFFGTKLGLELFTYNVNDLFSKSSGILAGGRVFFNPLDFFQVGLSTALDSNQISGLQDQDDDSHPDVVDYFPEDSDKFSREDKIKELKQKGFSDSDIDELLEKDNNSFSFSENQKDAISLFALDAVIQLNTIIDLPILLYTHAGVIIDDDDKQINSTNTKAQGFGYGLGFKYTVDNNLKFSLEYRGSQDRFKFGWFDESYENNRVQLDNGVLITKDNLVNSGNYNGVHGSLDLTLFSLGSLNLSYELLIGSDNNNQKLSGSIKIIEIFKSIPIITYLDIFYHNDFITNSDSFFRNNTFLFYGYNLGLDFGGILMNYLYRIDWVMQNGDLVENPTIRISVGKRL